MTTFDPRAGTVVISNKDTFLRFINAPPQPSVQEERSQRRVVALAGVQVPVVGLDSETVRNERERFVERVRRNLGPEGMQAFAEWEARRQGQRYGGHSSASLLASSQWPEYPK